MRRRDRPAAHDLRVDAGDPVAHDFELSGQAQLLGVLPGGDDDGGRAVGDFAGVSGRDEFVRGDAGEFFQGFQRRLADAFVAGQPHGLPGLVAGLEREHAAERVAAVEMAGSPRVVGALLREGGERVALPPRDPHPRAYSSAVSIIAVSARSCRSEARIVSSSAVRRGRCRRTPRCAAECRAPGRCGQRDIVSPPKQNRDASVVDLGGDADPLEAADDGLQARAADPLHHQCRDVLGEPAAEGDVPRKVDILHPRRGELVDVGADRRIDVLRIESAAVECLAARQHGQVFRRKMAERAALHADRRAGGAADHDAVAGVLRFAHGVALAS